MLLYITKSSFGRFELDAKSRNLPSRVNVAGNALLNAWTACLETQDSQYGLGVVRLPSTACQAGGRDLPTHL